MTVDEFIVKLEHFNDTLPEVRDKLILDAVFSSAALAKRRVIGSRTKHDGVIFGIYSPKYLKKRIKAGKGSDPRINFSYTNQMWQSTEPIIESSTEDRVVVRVAPRRPDREKIMGYHDKTYGEIIELSDSEIDGMTKDFLDGVQEFIDHSF